MYQEDIYKLSPNEWEWFAQDVLFHLGFIIHVGPSEGTDDGLDMIVERNDVKYLVSCKHNHQSRKNVGVREEQDIRDRVEQHECKGFIAFYSVGPTTALKKKITSLRNAGIDPIEIYLDDVLDIIPTMRGFVLQKHFLRPQEMHHHLIEDIDYKPLKCMKEGCSRDILSKERIPYSLAGFGFDDENSIHLIYGCKECLANCCTHGYWAEISQIRYVEQMLIWRSIIDDVTSQNKPASDFYKHWALLQEAILQIQVPQGWGRWI
ncbi:restriction endonuclease [Citrobacter freundii]|uniref:restriction endonuclease n=1 Tax=Citrobacter freundii TaxID=546 RepID=UPI0028C1BDA8|nr:restriction endonuclease [Citrobacter freundii]MDT7187112.1 restriction endonuclease [Citrobacter freundii]